VPSVYSAISFPALWAGDGLPSITVAPPGPQSRALAERLAAVECPAFELRRQARADTAGTDQSGIVYARGTGSVVECVDGNRYVDMTAGFGALALGYGHPSVTAAMVEQASRIELALGDVYAAEVKVRAQERIAALLGNGARVMLGSSGADAVTAALKTMQLATGKPGVIAFDGAYHGLTHGPLAALGLAPKFREPFAESLSKHIHFAPYPDCVAVLDASLTQVRAAFKTGGIGGVLVEPILGRGGCIVPPREFLLELRALCTEYGALLVADEVWTGCGRSGEMLASKYASPDIVCLGKALGAGYPISACVGTSGAMAAWGKHGGTAIHTATHFGNPIGAAVACAALDVIEKQCLDARAGEAGQALLAKLFAAGFGATGRGLMIGIELHSARDALQATRSLLRAGYIVLTGGRLGNVLTLTPALNIADQQVEGFMQALAADVLQTLEFTGRG
jgi:4-aminobutyrate aminotransferase / (S)-3-amino-2-methylpropionate transaminase / 5-aminovalerate transaminase